MKGSIVIFIFPFFLELPPDTEVEEEEVVLVEDKVITQRKNNNRKNGEAWEEIDKNKE